MKKRVMLLTGLCLVLVLGMVVLGACASSPQSSDTPDGEESAVQTTLNVGLNGDIKSLDPVYAYDTTTIPVVVQAMQGLLKYGANDELEPNIAESWEEVDSTTWVYQIRSNVTFSDGNPMTMDDVLYSLERHRDEEVGSYLAWMYDHVESIEKTGDWELTVKLSEPDAFWRYTFATTAGHIVEKSVVEAAGNEYGSVAKGIIGTGPYKLEKWYNGQQISFTYDENYWNKEVEGEPDVKRVVFQIIAEDATRSLALASGQIDLDLAVTVENVEAVKNGDNTSLAEVASGGFSFVAFNCQKPPFDDVNVRKAIAAAIDMPALQENVLKEYGLPTNYS
ncbi:MAG: ABC transporter substrate-binding protein, partial [Actinomycetes bacterium]|nr:ABC transporter substrate-binding protein [Actinomycetes bacterium]